VLVLAPFLRAVPGFHLFLRKKCYYNPIVSQGFFVTMLETLRLSERVVNRGFRCADDLHDLWGNANMRVRVLSLSGFPHWDEASKGVLSGSQRRARGRALAEVVGNEIAGKMVGSIAPFFIASHDDGKFKECTFLTQPFDMPARRAWGAITGLPESFVKAHPSDRRGVSLIMQLHEIGHMLGGDVNDELAADRFALNVARANGVDAQSAAAWIDARYLGMLTDKPRYWIAPALEAETLAVPPLPQEEVARAVHQIRRAVTLASFGPVKRKMAAWVPSLLDAGTCENYMRNAFAARPDSVFSSLNAFIEAGAFTADPAADGLARRIMTAATRFNQDVAGPSPSA